MQIKAQPKMAASSVEQVPFLMCVFAEKWLKIKTLIIALII